MLLLPQKQPDQRAALRFKQLLPHELLAEVLGNDTLHVPGHPALLSRAVEQRAVNAARRVDAGQVRQPHFAGHADRLHTLPAVPGEEGVKQPLDLLLLADLFQRLVDLRVQFLIRFRLEDVGGRTVAHRLEHIVKVRVARQKHHAAVPLLLPNPAQQLQAAHARHADIRDHQVDARPLEHGQRIQRTGGGVQIEVRSRPQQQGQFVRHAGLVIHQKHTKNPLHHASSCLLIVRQAHSPPSSERRSARSQRGSA